MTGPKHVGVLISLFLISECFKCILVQKIGFLKYELSLYTSYLLSV